MEQLNLEEIRKEINGINDEMLKLFTKRMELSAQVSRYKKVCLPLTEKEKRLFCKMWWTAPLNGTAHTPWNFLKK